MRLTRNGQGTGPHSTELRHRPWHRGLPRRSTGVGRPFRTASRVGAGGAQTRWHMLMQPRDHTHFPNRIPLVGSRNIWQDLGGGESHCGSGSFSSFRNAFPSPEPTSQIPPGGLAARSPGGSCLRPRRAAVAFPGGPDGGPEARKLPGEPFSLCTLELRSSHGDASGTGRWAEAEGPMCQDAWDAGGGGWGRDSVCKLVTSSEAALSIREPGRAVLLNGRFPKPQEVQGPHPLPQDKTVK